MSGKVLNEGMTTNNISKVECEWCGKRFPVETIKAHALGCLGDDESGNASYQGEEGYR